MQKMEEKDSIGINTQTDDGIVVPLTDFLDAISEKTGWSHHELLYEKDIGQVETKLKLKAKSPSILYKFLTPEARKWNRDFVTTLIGK